MSPWQGFPRYHNYLQNILLQDLTRRKIWFTLMLGVEICPRIYSKLLDCLNQDLQDFRIDRMLVCGGDF
jgi:hypothetical protein